MKNIFLHGLGQNFEAWNDVIDNTLKNDCPNLFTLIQDREMNYINLYNSFVKYCERYNEPVNICGLSLGGIIALQYVIEHPEKVNSIALVGTQYVMPKNILKIQNIIFRFLPQKQFEKMGVKKNDIINITATLMNVDFTKELSKICCKVLIVCGMKDKANIKASLQMQELIPNAKLELIEDAGHEVNKDNPHKLGAIVNDFFVNCNFQR